MATKVSGRTAVPGETSAPGAVHSGTTGPASTPREPAAVAGGRTPAPGAGSTSPHPARAALGRPAALTRAYWNTPRLLRGLTALCLVTLLTAAAVAATVLSGARDGIDAIGHRAAPQATRTADLYFALSDMDAQAANLLQIGADPDYTALRKQTLDTYEQRRAQADNDLQQAAEAAATDPAGHAAVQRVLGSLGEYEAQIARTLLLEDQAKAPAGKPSDAALQSYRQATDLLRRDLLPAADQVTAANAGTVDRVYTAQHDDLGAGWWWLLVTGVLALAALGLLQWTLAVRFRRTVNPPLAAVTLLTVITLAIGLNLAADADSHLVVAKRDAYDSVIALSRARAVAYDMNADESRYLADPSRATAYEQNFFDKTQAIVRIPGAELADYNGRLDSLAATHRANPSTVPFDGYLGAELRNVTFAGERDAAEKVLTAFQQYQRDDRTIRDLRNRGQLKEAVTFNTGNAAGQSNHDFGLLSDALGEVLDINTRAMDTAVSAADGELDSTTAASGGAALAAALALTVLGTRTRLREYR